MIQGSQSMPASVAQLDVHPIGVKEVVGSAAARSATFFHGDLIIKYPVFSTVILFLQLQQKNVHNTG